nr:ribonuclease H-like domain-containing protein [Tanacetum cinerariifolium]
MCDKKNSILFIDTAYVVLSPNFKLTDESHVLLKVPRKDNVYSVDLKYVVPQGGHTCIFIKATLDESTLWHMRLGHVNFKTINKLVKGNLIRGKFDGKVDEGFFVGCSTNNKAFRVVNSRTRIVEENLHVKFSENTPNIAESKPNWLFDIDALTKSMNYKPVIAGNQANGSAVYGCADDPNMPELEDISILKTPMKMFWFEDSEFLDKVYKVEKALYGLHQAPKAWTTSTPIETSKPLMKDENAKDVDVHLYRSMIGSLMYLTSSRPDIMFVTGVVDPNQMMDYGYNFMNTMIFIDNESTICIVKNPVFHSKTKHIEIRRHFIRDSYEKRLIQVLKIPTDHNVADLLTKELLKHRRKLWHVYECIGKTELKIRVDVVGVLRLRILYNLY